jgi:hypothetical protein
MGIVADFVQWILEEGPSGLTRRERFFKAPHEVLTERGVVHLEHRAVVYAMQRVLLVEWIKKNEGGIDLSDLVFKYDFTTEGGEGPGEKWDAGDVHAPLGSVTDCCENAQMAAGGGGAGGGGGRRAAGGAGGGGWTGPNPAVWTIDRDWAPLGEDTEIVLCGEGILNGAKLVLSTPYESTPHGYHETQLTVVCTGNFRRIYATATLALHDEAKTPRNLYEVCVQNDLGTPLLWWSDGMFEVR